MATDCYATGLIGIEYSLNICGVYREFDARSFLLQTHGAAGISITPALIQSLGHVGQGQVDQAHRYAKFPSQLGGQGYVLVGQAQSEIWRVILIDQIMF